jgi:hypothetical protein
MRKNRKIPKTMSVVASNTMHIGAVILMLFVMVILNILASSSCQQQHKEIGEKERELAKLEDSYTRESTRWEEMKTPERISVALRNHGLMMDIAGPDRIVRVRKNGRLLEGQISVKKARSKLASNSLMGVPRQTIYRRHRR